MKMQAGERDYEEKIRIDQ
jgi:hypothetical protein